MYSTQRVEAPKIEGLWFQKPYSKCFLGPGSSNIGYLDPLRYIARRDAEASPTSNFLDAGPTGTVGAWGRGFLGCARDLVSRLRNGPYRAYDGLLFGLTWDTKWTD